VKLIFRLTLLITVLSIVILWFWVNYLFYSKDFVDNLFIVNPLEYILTDRGRDDLAGAQNYALVYSDEFVSLYRINPG